MEGRSFPEIGLEGFLLATVDAFESGSRRFGVATPRGGKENGVFLGFFLEDLLGRGRWPPAIFV